MKSTSIAVLAAILAVSMTAIGSASAQTAATMPTLYNQYGQSVNVASNTSLAAGWYYLAPGAVASTQVDYLGNGMYYNPTTQLYGGSVNDPSGTAGVALDYVSSVENVPGIPNTGAGGEALAAWTLLVLSGMVAGAGIVYLAYARNSARKGLVLKRG